MRPTLPAAVGLLLLTTLARPVGANASQPIELPEGEPYLHEPSGFRFPPDVNTFARTSAYRYDETGHNVSVGYNDAALRCILTVYVYPNRGLPVAAHFDQVKRDVREVHRDAKPVAEGEWTLKQGDKTYTGRRAAFSFTVKIRGEAHDVVSEAYLLRHGGHFIKFRVTCPKEKYEPAADRVSRFLESLKLPEPAAAPGPEPAVK